MLETVCKTRCLFFFSWVRGVDAGNAQTWNGRVRSQEAVGWAWDTMNKAGKGYRKGRDGDEDADRIGSD